MEGIEDLATSILRTGKLSVQGEAGGTMFNSCAYVMAYGLEHCCIP